MKKVIIGILGTSEYMKTNDAFYDVYKYSNNYIKKIVENDAVPLLIPLVDDKLIEEIKSNPVLSQLDCVKNERFATIELESVLAGDRMAYTVEKLAADFYPDLF